MYKIVQNNNDPLIVNLTYSKYVLKKNELQTQILI